MRSRIFSIPKKRRPIKRSQPKPKQTEPILKVHFGWLETIAARYQAKRTIN